MNDGRRVLVALTDPDGAEHDGTALEEHRDGHVVFSDFRLRDGTPISFGTEPRRWRATVSSPTVQA